MTLVHHSQRTLSLIGLIAAVILIAVPLNASEYRPKCTIIAAAAMIAASVSVRSAAVAVNLA